MSDLDKRLEEWIASCECAESFHDNCTTANGLAAALLRARQFLHAIQGAPNVPTLEAAKELAREGYADTDLEELLR